MSTTAYTQSVKPGADGTQHTEGGNMMQIPALSNSNTAGSNGDENERATNGLIDVNSHQAE